MTQNKARPKQSYKIKSVDHALTVLEQFAHQSELGITTLSQNLGLHKNNIFRLLATLVSRGYIEQNQYTGNYRLGYKTVSLGHFFTRNTGIVNASSPVLQKLTDELNETVYLGIRVDTKIFYIFDVETKHALRVSSRIGESLPLYCTAIGKEFLACLGPEKCNEILEQIRWKPYTEHTIMDKEKLLKELEIVRERGYSLDKEETNHDVVCVGMPILNHSGEMIAGISVSTPIQRFSEDALVPALRKASLEISRAFGYVPIE